MNVASRSGRAKVRQGSLDNLIAVSIEGVAAKQGATKVRVNPMATLRMMVAQIVGTSTVTEMSTRIERDEGRIVVDVVFVVMVGTLQVNPKPVEGEEGEAGLGVHLRIRVTAITNTEMRTFQGLDSQVF
jgi:hypothetical protein